MPDSQSELIKKDDEIDIKTIPKSQERIFNDNIQLILWKPEKKSGKTIGHELQEKFAQINAETAN